MQIALRLLVPCLLAFTMLLSGCNTAAVKSTRGSIHVEVLYIRHNPEVAGPLMLDLIKQRLTAKAIPFEVIKSDEDRPGKIVMTYTMRRGWDVVTHVRHAEVTMLDGDTVIASAVFNADGVSLGKFRSAESKLVPLLDKLFDKIRVSSKSSTVMGN